MPDAGVHTGDKVKFLGEASEATAGAPAGERGEFTAELEEAGDGEVGGHGSARGDVADSTPEVGAAGARGFAEDEECAVGGRLEAEDEAQELALPGLSRAGEAKDGAFFDSEIDAAERQGVLRGDAGEASRTDDVHRVRFTADANVGATHAPVGGGMIAAWRARRRAQKCGCWVWG
jgi:hypothetical protein